MSRYYYVNHCTDHRTKKVTLDASDALPSQL